MIANSRPIVIPVTINWIFWLSFATDTPFTLFELSTNPMLVEFVDDMLLLVVLVCEILADLEACGVFELLIELVDCAVIEPLAVIEDWGVFELLIELVSCVLLEPLAVKEACGVFELLIELVDCAVIEPLDVMEDWGVFILLDVMDDCGV